MKVKWLSRNLAAPGPHLTLCTTENQFAQALKDLGTAKDVPWISPGANATCHIIDRVGGDQACVVCMHVLPERKPIEVAGLLVHEAVHVVQEYFKHIGEREPAIEQYAYAVQCVSQELMAAYADTLA